MCMLVCIHLIFLKEVYVLGVFLGGTSGPKEIHRHGLVRKILIKRKNSFGGYVLCVSGTGAL